jgi:hypothetical protein
VRAVPRLCEFYPGICLTTEETARINISQGKKNLSQGKKNLSQTLMILEFSLNFFVIFSNMTFQENSSGGRRVVPCGQTDGIVDFRNFANARLKRGDLFLRLFTRDKKHLWLKWKLLFWTQIFGPICWRNIGEMCGAIPFSNASYRCCDNEWTLNGALYYFKTSVLTSQAMYFNAILGLVA